MRLTNDVKFLVKRAEHDGEMPDGFKEHSQRLNIQKNKKGICICFGQIHRVYPLYLPLNHMLFLKIVEQAHHCTLHARASLTMSKVRVDYWIPTLRSLIK